MPDGVVVESIDATSPLVPVAFGGVLDDALDGVVLGRVVLVGGLQGAGKSTLCAELASRMAAKLRGLAYWLDAEMSAPLVAALFARTSSSTGNVRRVPKKPDAASARSIDWRDALAAVPPDAAVVVIDSIQRWAPRASDQTALLDAMAMLTPTVLAISHANKKGEIAGSNANQHDADAICVVSPSRIVTTKSRWTPTPRVVQRPAPPTASSSKKSATSS